METKNNKKYIIGGVVFFLVLVVGGFLIMFNTKKETVTQDKKEVLTQSEVIPTVDSSVKVELTSENNKEVTLDINSIPEGTLDIEYELSYITGKNVPKGVLGTIDVSGKSSVERKITLGTCSSGTCVYDEGVTSIKVSLKFNNDSGSKIFEKEFPLE